MSDDSYLSGKSMQSLIEQGYLRRGAQEGAKADWVRFMAIDTQVRSKWKFHVSVTSREAQEELATLAIRYGISQFKFANDKLREEFQDPADKQCGKTAVFYHSRKGRGGRTIRWKEFLDEAAEIVVRYGEGPPVQRDQKVDGYPGIYYRNERGVKGESYIARDGITGYMKKHGIPEDHAYNMNRLPDILEEIGIRPKTGRMIEQVEGDVNERKEDTAAAIDTRMILKDMRAKEKKREEHAPATPRGTKNHNKWIRKVGVAVTGAGLLAGGIYRLANPPVVQVQGPRNVASAPDRRMEMERVFAALSHQASLDNANGRGLPDNIAPTTTDERILSMQDDQAKLLWEKSQIGEYLKFSDATSMSVTRYNYTGRDNIKFEMKINIFRDDEVIANISYLPQFAEGKIQQEQWDMLVHAHPELSVYQSFRRDADHNSRKIIIAEQADGTIARKTQVNEGKQVVETLDPTSFNARGALR